MWQHYTPLLRTKFSHICQVTTKGFERRMPPNPCCHGLLYRVQQKNLTVFKEHCVPSHWSGRSVLESTRSSTKSNFSHHRISVCRTSCFFNGDFYKKNNESVVLTQHLLCWQLNINQNDGAPSHNTIKMQVTINQQLSLVEAEHCGWHGSNSSLNVMHNEKFSVLIAAISN